MPKIFLFEMKIPCNLSETKWMKNAYLKWDVEINKLLWKQVEIVGIFGKLFKRLKMKTINWKLQFQIDKFEQKKLKKFLHLFTI